MVNSLLLDFICVIGALFYVSIASLFLRLSIFTITILLIFLAPIYNVALDMIHKSKEASMVDEVDIANAVELERIENLLTNRTSERLQSIGLCHNCLEPISQAHFCDVDCRDDYEKRLWFRNAPKIL